MLVLGLDFETTGLDPSKDRVIEVGAVVWEVERKIPVLIMNALVKHAPGDNVRLSEEIEKLTGILQRDIDVCGVTPNKVFNELGVLMAPCEYVVAHNGNGFDKLFYEAELKRLGLSEIGKAWARPWIDTRLDIPYPAHMTARSAGYLETEHNLVNPFPHRAAFDVLTMLQILSNYDIQDVITHTLSPTVLVKANVSYDDRSKAKNRGYHWDATSKSWIKNLKETQVDGEREQADFEVIYLKKVS